MDDIIDTKEEQATEKPELNLEIDCKYRLILIAAQRSKQLQKGAKPRVAMDILKHKTTRIAIEEIKHKKVRFELTEEKK